MGKRKGKHNGREDEAGTDEGREEIPDLPDTLGSEMQPKALRWLWQGRIPWGMPVLFQGSKGSGKSSWMRAIAAHVTGGPRLFGCKGRPKVLGNVLWFAGEEPLESWVRPCCEAAGVDMDRIRFASNTSREVSDNLMLPGDAERLIRRIEQTKTVLVVLDPILAFSDGTLDIESGSIQPRQFMLHLQRICDATGCNMLCSRNLTKDTSRGALASGRGSGELANFVRSVLHCQELPGEVDRYGLATAARNLGPPVDTITYRMVAENGLACVQADGTCKTTADDMSRGEDGEMEKYALQRAKELIRQMLPTGKIASATVRARAELAMITARTLQAAAKQLGVTYSRTGSRDATVVYWHPPKKGYPPP